MTTSRWIAAGAFLAMVTASPALARDGDSAREGKRPAVERSLAVGRVESRPATSRAEVDKGRPCCVTNGKSVHDHLRG
jgi:hypothetical protein